MKSYLHMQFKKQGRKVPFWNISKSQQRGWRSGCWREICGRCVNLNCPLSSSNCWVCKHSGLHLNVSFKHGKCFVVFTPKKDFAGIFFSVGIRGTRENRQPLHVWTWDPIHNSLGSDYQRGRWCARVCSPIQNTSKILQNVKQEKLVYP